jgi:hypothetical protein
MRSPFHTEQDGYYKTKTKTKTQKITSIGEDVENLEYLCPLWVGI